VREMVVVGRGWSWLVVVDLISRHPWESFVGAPPRYIEREKEPKSGGSTDRYYAEMLIT
jgi:hypothetical protein